MTKRNNYAIARCILHRTLLDPVPPVDADTDTAAMAGTAGAIKRGERHLELLAELGEIGMKLARSLGELAQSRIEREITNDDAPARSEDAAAAFDRMAQTVRPLSPWRPGSPRA